MTYEKISKILLGSHKSPRILSGEWESIVRYLDYFFPARIIKEYLPISRRYQKIHDVSGIEELRNELLDSLDMLERSIQSSYEEIIAEKNLKIQYSILAIQVLIIFSIFNSFNDNKFNAYSLIYAFASIILVYLFTRYSPKFEEILKT